MDKLSELYNLYLSEGIISKNISFEKFSSADSNIKSGLYKIGVEKNLFKQTTAEQFNSAWSAGQDEELFVYQPKTNAVAEPVATATAKQPPATDTALPLVNGSLGLQKDNFGSIVKNAKSALNNISLSKAEIKEIEENSNKLSTKIVTAPSLYGVVGGAPMQTPVYSDYIEQAKKNIAKQKKISVYQIPKNDWSKEARQLYIDAEKQKLLERKIEESSEELEKQIYGPWYSGKRFLKAAAKFSLLPGARTTQTISKTKEDFQYAAARKELSTEFAKESAEANDQYKSSIKNINTYSSLIKTADITLSQIENKFNTTPEEVNQDDLDKYNEILQTRQSAYGKYENLYNSLGELETKSNDFKTIADLTKRTYNNLDVATNRIASTVIKTAAGLGDFITELSAPQIIKRFTGVDAYSYVPFYLQNVGLGNDSVTKKSINFLYEQAEELEKATKKNQELGEIKTVEDFGEFMLDLFSEQAVNTAITVSTGGGGLLAISAAAGGNKFHEMNLEIENDPTLKISAAQFYGAGLMYGAAEYFTEKVSLGQAKRALNYMGFAKNNFSKAYDLAGGAYSLENFKLSKRLLDYGINVNKEGGAEFGAQLMNNFTDKYILDKDVSITQGLGEAYLTGSLMSGLGFQAPILAGDIYKAFTSNDSQKRINSRLGRIFELRKNMDAIIKDNKSADDSSKQEAVVIMLKELDNLLLDNLKDKKVSESKIDALTRSDKRTLLDTESEIYRQKRGVDKINNNSNLDEKTKSNLIEENIKKIELLEVIKNRTLEKALFSKDKEILKKSQTLLATEKGLKIEVIAAKNQKEATEQGLKYIEDALASNKITPEQSTTLKKDLNLSDEMGANGYYLGAEEGLPIMFAIEDQAIKNSKGSVVRHETAHGTLFRKIFAEDVDALSLVAELETYVKKNYKGAKKKLAEVEKIYSSKEFDQIYIAEEKLAAILEYVSDIDISKDKTFSNNLLSKFKAFTKNEPQKEIESIKTGKDVFNLITSFARVFDGKEISGLASKVLSGEIKVIKQKTNEIKSNINKKGFVPFSLSGKNFTEKDKTDLFSTTNKKFNEAAELYGLDIKLKGDGTPDFTKQQWDALDNNTKLGLGFLIGENFSPYVSYLMGSRRDVPGFDELAPQIIERVSTGLEKGDDGIPFLVKTYDPSKGTKLTTHIFGQIARRLQGVIDKTAGFGKMTVEAAPTESGRGELISEETAEFEIEKEERAKTETQKEFSKIADEIIVLDEKQGTVSIGKKVADEVKRSVKVAYATMKFKNEIGTKEFRTELANAMRNKLGNLFREIMDRGVNFDNNKKLTNKEKRDNYDSFVDANFKNMYSIMPKSTIADRFPFLMEPIKNEDGTLYSMSVAEVDAYNDAIDRGEIRGKKIANKYANNKAYKKKDYSAEVKKEGTEYLKANDKATNVRNARKVSFADVIAEEAAFDVLPEILIENNLAPEAAILEIQKQIGRVKFSLKLNDAEKNNFDTHSDAFFKDLLQVKNLNTKNIKRILNSHYKDLLPEKKLQSIVAQFASLLKPVSKIEITERESIEDIKEYIIDIVTQVDGFKTLAQLTGVKGGIEALFRNPLELKIAREATVELMQEIIDNNENLSLDQKVSLIYTFANSTFNSSGIIGIFKYDESAKDQFKLSERTGNYKDLYSGINDIKDNLFSQLNFGGYKIKSIDNKGIILEKGKEQRIVENEYSASTLITQKMLDGSFEYNDKNAKAAQIFVTSIFENIGKLVLDNSTKAILLATLMDGSSNALRAAAPVWGISTKKPTENYKGVISDIPPTLNYKNYVYEHTVPARVAFTYLYDYHINGNKKINIEALWNDYKVTIIPREMDAVINDSGFKSITTSDYFPGGDVPWSNRYYNLFTRGKIQSTIQSWDGKETIGEGYEKYFKEAGAKPSIKAEAATEVKVIQNAGQAIENASKIPFSLSSKGISVYDFDDTLAFSKSKVIVNQKGKTFKINAAEFAEKGNEILADGGVFDFSEFSKVVDGKAGPLVPRLKKAIEKFGNKNIFVLTARPVDSAPAIYEFLKGLGLEIPIENITGLANSTAQAKANWMVGKVAEGYNDFYFVDDALQNVTAVKEVLNNFDVKGKVQQAKVKFSLSLDKEFNEMIERQKGIESYKEFSKVVAKRRGKAQNRFKFFIPPSAEDFRGLTQYVFAGKGTQGEIDQKFFEESLMNPYFKGIAEIERVKQKVKQDIKGINIMFKPVAKNLGNLIPDGDFTFDAAMRVYLWNKAGYEVPNISKRDNAKLIKLVSEDADLSAYANALLLASRKEKWLEPNEYWDAQTLLTDLNNLTEKQYRKEYLAEFIENANIIFSDKNLNKIEAGYGGSLREAIENALYSMKTGTNRPQGGDRITDAWLNWVNNSIGTIMFFNRRSAVLQTISSINFINWSDNNPLKAGLAFANQSQYWKDFSTLFNSDKLKERRSGLKSDVQEQEIANAAKGAKDKAAAIVSYLLKIGFTPTQLADSFAIASGGATFYRNRINTYKNQVDAEGNKLYTEKEAETKAFEDFSKLSDEAQQSGDPALVSQQQRSVAGRLILAFQNTPMQYARLIKKASQDLVNKRGDAKTHISKILYYGAVQNIIFTALQNAAFALIPGFDDEDDDEKKQVSKDKKITRGLNSMIDSLLRGLGIYGAILATTKNVAIKIIEEDDKGFKGNPANIVLEAANISPPIGSKLRKLHSSYQTYQFDKDVIKQNPWNINVGGKFNPSPTYNIVGNISSAAFNIPLDRMLSEIDGVKEALDNRNTIYQRIALAAGWRTWDVNAKNEEFDLIKIEAKAIRKKEGIEKSKETRRKNRKPTTKRSIIKRSVLKKSIIK